MIVGGFGGKYFDESLIFDPVKERLQPTPAQLPQTVFPFAVPTIGSVEKGELIRVIWPDTFVEEGGLAPNKPADKTTLMRRLYFDLIGLPPTREELREFLTPEITGEMAHAIFLAEKIAALGGKPTTVPTQHKCPKDVKSLRCCRCATTCSWGRTHAKTATRCSATSRLFLVTSPFCANVPIKMQVCSRAVNNRCWPSVAP